MLAVNQDSYYADMDVISVPVDVMTARHSIPATHHSVQRKICVRVSTETAKHENENGHGM